MPLDKKVLVSGEGLKAATVAKTVDRAEGTMSRVVIEMPVTDLTVRALEEKNDLVATKVVMVKIGAQVGLSEGVTMAHHPEMIL